MSARNFRDSHGPVTLRVADRRFAERRAVTDAYNDRRAFERRQSNPGELIESRRVQSCVRCGQHGAGACGCGFQEEGAS